MIASSGLILMKVFKLAEPSGYKLKEYAPSNRGCRKGTFLSIFV